MSARSQPMTHFCLVSLSSRDVPRAKLQAPQEVDVACGQQASGIYFFASSPPTGVASDLLSSPGS